MLPADTLCVILAGAGKDTKSVSGRSKCFAKLNGRQIYEYTLDCARDVGAGNIVVACNSTDAGDVRRYDSKVGLLESEKSIILAERLVQAHEYAKNMHPGCRLLVLYADHCFPTKKGLEDALRRACLVESGVVLPVVPSEFQSVYREFYSPNFFHCHEYKWAHTGIVVAEPSKVNLACLDDITSVRKPFQLGLLNSMVTLPRIALNVSRLLGPEYLLLLKDELLASLSDCLNLQSAARSFAGNIPVVLFNELGRRILGAPIHLLATPYAELSLEVDLAKYLKPFEANYHQIVQRIASEHKLLDLMDGTSTPGLSLARRDCIGL